MSKGLFQGGGGVVDSRTAWSEPRAWGGVAWRHVNHSAGGLPVKGP